MVELEQPPNAGASARKTLLKAGEAHPPPRCLHTKPISLLLEPKIQLFHRDRNDGVAPDDDHGYAALRSAGCGLAGGRPAANGTTVVA